MASSPPPLPAPTTRQAWLAITAVLLGAFISTLTARLSAFGLADVRGGLHAGFDEGAWLTTVQTAGQMLVTPVAIWAGGAYGPRRVLSWGVALFTVSSALLPMADGIGGALVFQFLCGLGSGTFIPLTLPVLLRSLPAKYWAIGIAVYALNLELSLNISASLEAWYVDHGDWRFIFWQNVPLGIAMLACLRAGFEHQPLAGHWSRPKVFGVLSVGLGLALVYAGLDQGNRLDWLSSGTVVGLLASGGILLLGSLCMAVLHPSSWFDLRASLRWPLPLLLVNVLVLRLTILSTAYLIPQFLTSVRGFRTFEVGEALLWIAAPQLVTAPIAALLLRRIDSRWTASAGLLAIAAACWIVANSLTPAWGPREFLPTQLLQALGQSFALSGIVYTAILRMRPETALTFGAMLQSTRLLGGEIGLAVTATFVRMREQHASNLIGQHVTQESLATIQRLEAYRAIAGQHSPTGLAQAEGLALLGGAVRRSADLQSVIDGFYGIGMIAAAALAALIVLGHAPAGPGTPAAGRKSS